MSEKRPLTMREIGKIGGAKTSREHLAAIAKKGGDTLKEKHGQDYYKKIGQMGARARHGLPYDDIKIVTSDISGGEKKTHESTIQEAGKKGGDTTKARHPDLYKKIGKEGGEKVKKEHEGTGFYQKIGKMGGDKTAAKTSREEYVKRGKVGGKGLVEKYGTEHLAKIARKPIDPQIIEQTELQLAALGRTISDRAPVEKTTAEELQLLKQRNVEVGALVKDRMLFEGLVLAVKAGIPVEFALPRLERYLASERIMQIIDMSVVPLRPGSPLGKALRVGIWATDKSWKLQVEKKKKEEREEHAKAAFLGGFFEARRGGIRLNEEGVPEIEVEDKDESKINMFVDLFGGRKIFRTGRRTWRWQVSKEKAVELVSFIEKYAPSQRNTISLFREWQAAKNPEDKIRIAEEFKSRKEQLSTLSPIDYDSLVVDSSFMAGVYRSAGAQNMHHGEQVVHITSTNAALLEAIRLEYVGSIRNVSMHSSSKQLRLGKRESDILMAKMNRNFL